MRDKIKNIGKYIFLTYLLFSSPNSSSEEIDFSSPEQCIKVSTLCDSLSVKGEFYKVIDAVYQQDFKSTIENEMVKINPSNKELDSIDSYEFSITKNSEKNKYYVGVGSAVRLGNPPVLIGSIHYILDATTLKILDKYQKH